MGEQWSDARGDAREWDERINELYDFLTEGSLPDGVEVDKFPNLSPDQAGSLIWFLQEITGVLPDNFDQCKACGIMFDSHTEGIYVEATGESYCDNHIPTEGEEE